MRACCRLLERPDEKGYIRQCIRTTLRQSGGRAEATSGGAGIVKPRAPTEDPETPEAAAGGLQVRDLSARLRRIASGLPGAAYAEDRFQRLEDTLLGELKARLDRLDGRPARPVSNTPRSPRDEDSGERTATHESPAQLLARRLEESTQQDHAGAQDAFYVRLLNALSPDEVRILAALSDGAPHPLVHAGYGPPIGPLTRRVAENLSNVGRAAQVRVLENTPHYIARMQTMGLVETARADRSLDVKYQIIENDLPVREMVAKASQETGKKIRFARHTLRLAPLGACLWNACQQDLGETALGWGEQ